MESAACRVIYVSVVLDVFIQVYMFECGSYAAHTVPDSAHRPAQPLATACRAHEPSLLDSRRTRSPQLAAVGRSVWVPHDPRTRGASQYGYGEPRRFSGQWELL